MRWEQRDAINNFSVMTTLKVDHTWQTKKSSDDKRARTFTTAHIHDLFQNALETNKMAALPTNIRSSRTTTHRTQSVTRSVVTPVCCPQNFTFTKRQLEKSSTNSHTCLWKLFQKKKKKKKKRKICRLTTSLKMPIMFVHASMQANYNTKIMTHWFTGPEMLTDGKS